MTADDDYRWFGRGYAVAIEPNTSYPGQGLTTVIEKTGMHRTLEPGSSEQITITASVFRSGTGVRDVATSGEVYSQLVPDPQ